MAQMSGSQAAGRVGREIACGQVVALKAGNKQIDLVGQGQLWTNTTCKVVPGFVDWGTTLVLRSQE